MNFVFCLTFQCVTSCFDIWHRDHLVHSKKVQEVIEKLYFALDDIVLANKVIDNYYNESPPQSPSQPLVMPILKFFYTQRAP